MEIEIKQPDTKSWEQIKQGELFMYEEKVYVKAANEDNTEVWNSLEVGGDGDGQDVNHTELVHPVKKIVVEV